MIRLTTQEIDRWHDEFNEDDEDRAAHAGKAVVISQEKADAIAREIADRQFATGPDDETVDSGIVLEVLADHALHPAFENKISGAMDLVEGLKSAAISLGRTTALKSDT